MLSTSFNTPIRSFPPVAAELIGEVKRAAGERSVDAYKGCREGVYTSLDPPFPFFLSLLSSSSLPGSPLLPLVPSRWLSSLCPCSLLPPFRLLERSSFSLPLPQLPFTFSVHLHHRSTAPSLPLFFPPLFHRLSLPLSTSLQATTMTVSLKPRPRLSAPVLLQSFGCEGND